MLGPKTTLASLRALDSSVDRLLDSLLSLHLLSHLQNNQLSRNLSAIVNSILSVDLPDKAEGEAEDKTTTTTAARVSTPTHASPVRPEAWAHAQFSAATRKLDVLKTKLDNHLIVQTKSNRALQQRDEKVAAALHASHKRMTPSTTRERRMCYCLPMSMSMFLCQIGELKRELTDVSSSYREQSVHLSTATSALEAAEKRNARLKDDLDAMRDSANSNLDSLRAKSAECTKLTELLKRGESLGDSMRDEIVKLEAEVREGGNYRAQAVE